MNQITNTENTPSQLDKFTLLQRRAMALANSDLVPVNYRAVPGDEKKTRLAHSNCMIALNLADNMNCDPIMITHKMNPIHGKPSWSSEFLISCFNKSNKFSCIKYKFFGERKTNNYGCLAYATELATGETIEGTVVDMQMAHDEGWLQKAGSKWKTMPEQMLRYRAATFFIRAYVPEIAMGFYTTEELTDFVPESKSVMKTINELYETPTIPSPIASTSIDPVSTHADFIKELE